VTEIEFLDPGRAGGSAGAEADPTYDDPADDETAGPDLRRLVPALAAAVAWVLAAGLTVMASVSTVYELVYDSGDDHQTISVDAWGRFNTGSLNQSVGHQTRYAIVLIAAAVLLLAAALVAVVRLPVGRYLAVAGTAVTAGTVTTLILYVDATRDANDIRARQLATAATVATDLGAAVWLTLGATAAAAVGIVLAFVLKAPAEPGNAEPGNAERDESPDAPADEAMAGYPAEAVQPVPGGGVPAG